MTADRARAVTSRSPTAFAHLGVATNEGAVLHPRFLRFGPWALSAVVATLFGLSFATSYAALYEYARELDFSREFAIAFPLVLDAVIVVLAVTLLLERALGRRTIRVRGRDLAVRLPTWPLLSLWAFFAGSVAGNVGHAPPILPAQLVAAVPPVSAALTFHLLLRLLDRAGTLRDIAEAYEERSLEERERAAQRKARRNAVKARRLPQYSREPAPTGALDARQRPAVSSNGGRMVNSDERSNGHRRGVRLSSRRVDADSGQQDAPTKQLDDLDVLRERVQEAMAAGESVTGATVATWLGVSARTGRRKLAALLGEEPTVVDATRRD